MQLCFYTHFLKDSNDDPWHAAAPGTSPRTSPFTFQTEWGLAPDHSAGPLTVLQREHHLHPAAASPLAIMAGTHGDMTGAAEVWMFSG